MTKSAQTFRTEMRQYRRALTTSEREYASAAICSHILRSNLFMKACRIALFLPNDGEIDISPVLNVAWQRRKQCFLPVLSDHGKKLFFAPMTPDSPLRDNHFGIPEPMAPKRAIHTPRQLDLVLTPLVAFDKLGNRIGMGGGYYDRSFGFLRRHQNWLQPRLIGIGFDFQCVRQLPSNPWDVPLTGAFTEQGYYKLK